MTTARILKKLMEQEKLSARKLAKETGLSQSTISDILAGRQPTVKSVQALALHFKVSIDYLVNGNSVVTTNLENFEFETLFNGIVRIHVERLKK